MHRRLLAYRLETLPPRSKWPHDQRVQKTTLACGEYWTGYSACSVAFHFYPLRPLPQGER